MLFQPFGYFFLKSKVSQTVRDSNLDYVISYRDCTGYRSFYKRAGNLGKRDLDHVYPHAASCAGDGFHGGFDGGGVEVGHFDFGDFADLCLGNIARF